MAAPPSKSLSNLSGTWKLNKPLSSTYTDILTFQGVSSLLSRAIGAASITLRISQPSRSTIHVEQSATAASIPGTAEHYELDWQWRDSKDAFFGEMRGKSRWVRRSEIDADVDVDEDGVRYLKEGGEGDEGEEEEVVQAISEKRDGKWRAVHVWGFEQADGRRRYTRRVVVRNREGETKTARIVYDWEGE